MNRNVDVILNRNGFIGSMIRMVIYVFDFWFNGYLAYKMDFYLKRHYLCSLETVFEFEKKLIKQALIESEGNVTRTAKTLNVQRTTLIEKINKYSINLT